MALTGPSEYLTPIAEYTCPQHPQHAQVARHPIIPIVPRAPTREPRPKLPDGPGHPRAPGLFARLQLLAEPLGACLAPDRQLAQPRLTAYVRSAEKGAGLRV